ncbi:MAG TPA: hypoxanthine phosphoribosyltransferase [Flavobacteriales bacterium]|nr:hypoxanthine phosphoribosyltransferase [Flavobacteriales bacterium]
MIQVRDKAFRVYIPKDEISAAIERVAGDLSKTYANSDPLFLCVLNGAFMFCSDLMKAFTSPSEIGFIKAASYEGMESTGKVKFHEAGQLNYNNRDIIIVEDIIDTGNTLKALYEYLGKHNPKSIKVCTLLFKKEAYQQSLPIDYVCFETENKFLLGYGLDYDGYGRNLPEVYILND